MQEPKTLGEVRAILENIDYPGHTFRLEEKADGFLLQLRYYEQDVTNPNGPPIVQAARKWYISPYSTTTEIVETVYAAALRSAKHRVREHIRYKGQRVMSPHFDVEARIELCKENRYDVRK